MNNPDEIQHGERVIFYNKSELTGRMNQYEGLFMGHYKDGLCEVLENSTGLTWMIHISEIYLPVTLKAGNPNYDYKVLIGVIKPRPEIKKKEEAGKRLSKGLEKAAKIAELAEKKRKSLEEKKRLNERKMSIKSNLRQIKKMGI